MRENMGLYRGKRTYNGEWVYGGIWVNSSLVKAKIPHILDESGNPFEVDPSTIGEYTGLTDKNGKRIFEEDVVSGLFLYALPINGVCVFRDGAFGLEWERGGAKQFTAFTSMCNVEFEVIGNVHDNPELKEDC